MAADVNSFLSTSLLAKEVCWSELMHCLYDNNRAGSSGCHKSCDLIGSNQVSKVLESLQLTCRKLATLQFGVVVLEYSRKSLFRTHWAGPRAVQITEKFG